MKVNLDKREIVKSLIVVVLDSWRITAHPEVTPKRVNVRVGDHPL
jgi:hypothetical protein